MIAIGTAPFVISATMKSSMRANSLDSLDSLTKLPLPRWDESSGVGRGLGRERDVLDQSNDVEPVDPILCQNCFPAFSRRVISSCLAVFFCWCNACIFCACACFLRKFCFLHIRSSSIYAVWRRH